MSEQLAPPPAGRQYEAPSQAASEEARSGARSIHQRLCATGRFCSVPRLQPHIGFRRQICRCLSHLPLVVRVHLPFEPNWNEFSSELGETKASGRGLAGRSPDSSAGMPRSRGNCANDHGTAGRECRPAGFGRAKARPLQVSMRRAAGGLGDGVWRLRGTLAAVLVGRLPAHSPRPSKCGSDARSGLMGGMRYSRLPALFSRRPRQLGSAISFAGRCARSDRPPAAQRRATGFRDGSRRQSHRRSVPSQVPRACSSMPGARLQARVLAT